MSQFKRLFIFIFLFFSVVSCGPRSLEDFKEEGRGMMRSLIEDLKAIHTREELIASSGRLQWQFDRLVSLMILAEEFRVSHSEIEKEESSRCSQSDLSDQLRVELNRLYCIEGGRQIIEKCQEKALHRLDAFEKRQMKN